MFEGRVFQAERVEFRAASSVSKSLPGTGNGSTEDCVHEGYLTLYSAPDYGLAGPESEIWFDDDPLLGWIKFAELYCYSAFGSDVSGYSFTIPSLGISESASPGTYADSVEATVEIDDYKLYVHNSGVWRLRYGAIRLYFNGGLINSWTGGTLDGTTVLNPWSMPFLGVYPKLHGTIAATWTQGFPTIGPFSSVPFDWDEEASADQTLGGGIRFLQDSNWFAWSVTASSPSYPSVGGACAASVGGVDASDTWNTTLSQSSSRREVGAFCTETDPNVSGGVAVIRRDVWTVGELSKAEAWLWPDNERGVQRWVPSDYRALWFRWGFPWATGQGAASYQAFDDPIPSLPAPYEDSQTDETTILAAKTQLLGAVGPSAHTIEDAMSTALPMPTILSGSYARQQEASDTQEYSGFRLSDWFPIVDGVYTGLPPACPNSAFDPPNACFADQSWEYPYRVQTVDDSSGDIPNVHRHRHPYVRLWATWFNPHWSYGLWFPPDDADESVQWKIGGGSAAAKDYWLLIAQQHITHPALSLSEDKQTRNFVISEPLQYSGLRDLIESSYLNQWTSWVGISRFEAIAPVIPATKTLDATSEPSWSAEDAALSFGADITIDADGSGPATITIKLDIGRFDDSAYQYPYLCKSVFLNWETSNIDEVRVFLESYTGRKVLLEQTPGDGFTTRNVVYDLPRGSDDKYAGSYAQDHALGYIPDTGTDSQPEGISAALMADTERQFALGLLQDGQGVFLTFEVDVLDCEVDATLHYPRWEIQEEDPAFVVETSSTGALVFPDGPGIRLGQFRYWDYGFDSFLTTPELWPLNARMSALDALCLRRVGFEAKGPEDGLDTEISSIYENGIEYTLRAHLARDPIELRQQTTAFITQGENDPVVFVLVSSLREPPPLAGFPFRKRDSDWQPTGAHAQVSYSNDVEPRRYLKNSSYAVNLHEPGGSAITTMGTAPDGWLVTEHRWPTDGSEDLNYELRIAGLTIGQMRPWDGTFVLYRVNKTDLGGVASARSLEGFYAEAQAGPSGVAIQFVYGPYPLPSFSVSGFIAYDGDHSSPCLAIRATDRQIWLVVIRDGDAYRHWSLSDASSWSAAELTFEGVEQVRNFYDDDSKGYGEMAFRYDSGTDNPGKLYGRYQEGGETSLSSEFTVANYDTGIPLSVTDAGFDVVVAHDASRSITLVCWIYGESERSTWVSHDHARSFRRVSA